MGFGRRLNKEENDTYWRDAMSRRMDRYDETTRLTTALRGFYSADDEGHRTLWDFWRYAKRPYGNKGVEDSIAFNLGWDWKRVLIRNAMPEWVKAEAEAIHRLVGERIEHEERAEEG